jgi:hypothetical protein
LPPQVIAALIAAALANAQESRAVAYLARESASWRPSNGCFSCHNNGDAARALYVAAATYPEAREALAETNNWLAHPERWNENRGNPAVSDKALAAIQFASALAQGLHAGEIAGRTALAKAAAALVSHQSASGAWEIDPDSGAGSPCTYGPALATHFAAKVLELAGAHPGEARRAREWLRNYPPRSNVDRAAILMAFPGNRRIQADLLAAQSGDGGWGPHPKTPSENFDTALALIALAQSRGPAAAAGRGRRFLLERQQESGGWQETTRPAGSQSYAQHISTSAWAALALIATNGKGHEDRLFGRLAGDFFEHIDVKRPAHPVAGQIFERRIDLQTELAGRPGAVRHERPPCLVPLQRRVPPHALHVDHALRQRVIQRLAKIDDQR